jgi:hypothetical protein
MHGREQTGSLARKRQRLSSQDGRFPYAPWTFPSSVAVARALVARAFETVGVALGWRARCLRPPPNASLLLTNGRCAPCLACARLAAEASVKRWREIWPKTTRVHEELAALWQIAAVP